jgi:pre-mRNA-splicing factor 18
MDILKKELARKKQALKEAKEAAAAGEGNIVGEGRKFFKAGELRRLQQEREDALAEKHSNKRHHDMVENENGEQKSSSRKRRLEEEEDTDESGGNVGNAQQGNKEQQDENNSSGTAAGAGAALGSGDADDLSRLSPDDITQKLRSMGLPVWLFGEKKTCNISSSSDKKSNANDDEARRGRLRQALEELSKSLASLSERDDFRLETGQSIRNRFLEKDEALDSSTRASAAASLRDDEEDEERDGNDNKDGSAKKKKKDEDLSKDPHKKIYKYFKGLLKNWEDDLAKRPTNVKLSIAGKNETKTMQQCKDYIKPLFKLCKSRSLEEGLMLNIIKIIDACLQGEFVQAHDTYMDVAIGRAAWPIGVTMVGIHARKGRAKIESQNVAHVMNSELQRKYLTSIKRLMTYAQSQRPDVDPSKKVMN